MSYIWISKTNKIMKKFTFKFKAKYKEVLSYSIKDAFIKLCKKDRLEFTEVHCDETGEVLSDVEVFALFGHEISL